MAPAKDVTRFICLFHSEDRARSAVYALESAGIERRAISVIGDGDSEAYEGPQSLSGLGVPERDLRHLQDGLKHGGIVVALEALESRSDTIESIFHRYSADKIDEADVQTADPVKPVAAASSDLPAATAYSAGEPITNQVIVPVAEEALQVSRREVDRGGVRVYRRTVEEPVQREVDLHSERVVLEYREVNRPVTDTDLRAGQQAIELIETAEVPVVEKISRVVEEVRIGKVAEDRTEVVNDTVRHTEIQVDPVEATEPNSSRG